MKLLAMLFVIGVAFVAGHIYGDRAKDEVATILNSTQEPAQ